MKHPEQSPLAGKTVKIKASANQLGGQEYRVEDWWDRVSGDSWAFCNGNPACLQYGMRTGFSRDIDVPDDDEVLYGKVGALGHLVHVCELDEEESK